MNEELEEMRNDIARIASAVHTSLVVSHEYCESADYKKTLEELTDIRIKYERKGKPWSPVRRYGKRWLERIWNIKEKK